MDNSQNRRSAIKNLIAGTAAITASGMITSFTSPADNEQEFAPLKGNINHSVCQWCYNFVSIEELCQAVKKIGFSAIDLVGPKDWPTLQKYGMFSSMCYHGGKVSLTNGFNRPEFHEQLIKDYTDVIPLMAKAGYKNLICFSGSLKRGNFAGEPFRFQWIYSAAQLLSKFPRLFPRIVQRNVLEGAEAVVASPPIGLEAHEPALGPSRPHF